jgi:hypothetical protein
MCEELCRFDPPEGVVEQGARGSGNGKLRARSALARWRGSTINNEFAKRRRSAVISRHKRKGRG